MFALLSLMLTVVAAAAVPASDPADGDAAFTAAIVAELQAQDAEAADLLERADAARILGDLSQAGALYAELVERVPGVDHAWRRHCTVLQEAGLRDEALSAGPGAVGPAREPGRHGLCVAGRAVGCGGDPG